AFCEVAMGAAKTLPVSLLSADGRTVHVTAVDGDRGAFTVTFAEATLVVTFAPPLETVMRREHHAELVVRAGEASAPLVLDGTAFRAPCQVPAAIDFGAVAVG